MFYFDALATLFYNAGGNSCTTASAGVACGGTGSGGSTDHSETWSLVGIVLGCFVGLGVVLYLVYRVCRYRDTVTPAALGVAPNPSAVVDVELVRAPPPPVDAAFTALDSVLGEHRSASLRPFPPLGVSTSALRRVLKLIEAHRYDAAIDECIKLQSAFVGQPYSDAQVGVVLARAYCLVQLGRLDDAERALNQPNMFNDASIMNESVYSQPEVIDELAHIQLLVAVFSSLEAVTAAAVAAVDGAAAAASASASAARVAVVLAKALTPLGAEMTRAPRAYEQCIDALLHLRMIERARQLVDEFLFFAPDSQFAHEAKERCSWVA